MKYLAEIQGPSVEQQAENRKKIEEGDKEYFTKIDEHKSSKTK